MFVWMDMLMIAVFATLLSVLCIYGGHRLWMVWRAAGLPRVRSRHATPRADALPSVTVQLPMYNEANVAARVIEAAAALDYPRDRLEIQVLDDSTDHSAAVARECCARLASAGVNIVCMHRDNRNGYKAGALANGLRTARGEFIAVFDADFVPPRDFLLRVMDAFDDPDVGMVQARWAHLNAAESLLTRVQALLLDGHFLIEQRVRASIGRWFNFNGTAGVWRRAAIDDAGGWSCDTLTEDTDLSYRAQLAGWRFVYRADVQCPAELPPTMRAFISQQQRWNKGLIETAIKLWPRIVRSDEPWRIKAEAWFHLTAPLLYPVLALLITVATAYALFAGEPAAPQRELVAWLWGASLALGTIAAAAFYGCALWMRGRGGWRGLPLIPLIMAVGAGISLANTAAIVSALLRRQSPFVRTPKFDVARQSSDDAAGRARGRLQADGAAELFLAGVLVVCVAAMPADALTLLGRPFIVLFALGLAMTGVGSLRRWRPGPAASAADVSPAGTIAGRGRA